MRILLVEDESLSLKAISGFLTYQLGHSVTECQDSTEALKSYKEKPFPLVISDIRLPGIDGIQLTRAIKKLPQSQFTDIILITGYGNMNSAIQALRAGAYDYLLKPIDVQELESIVNRVKEHLSLLKENVDLKFHFNEKLDQATKEVQQKYKQVQAAYSKIVGVGCIGIFSDQMREVKALADKFHQDRSLPILIEGETGTGKEVVARIIHYGEGEVTAPFIPINCTAIPSNLFETELFGYEEGAFTDAKKKGTVGKMELAQGGTVFLDEIGDLPLNIQPKLLRVLEERSFYRVGGLKKIELDIRIICATNQNLLGKVKQGKFREDLFYRLNVGHIQVPPLRKQKGAIAPLAQMFLMEFSKKKNKQFQYIHEDAITLLNQYPWPGNVRELQNIIERSVLLYENFEILPQHIDYLSNGQNNMQKSWKQHNVLNPDEFELPAEKLELKKLEDEIVKKVLSRFNGNKTKTAEYLGLTRSALRSRLKDL